MRRVLEKYKNLSLPLRAAMWFTICNFALKGISFISMPLYTRLLPSDEYGRMSVLTSYETIFCIFATFEIYLGAFQRGLLKYKEDQRGFEQATVLIANTLTVLSFFVIWLFKKPFTEFTGISLGLYTVFSVYFIVFAPYSCWLNKKRFDYDYKAAVTITLSMSLLANLLPVLTIQIWGKSAFVKVISTYLISSVFCLPFWIRDFRPLRLLQDMERVKEYVSFSLKFQGPLVFHSLSYYILNQSDRIMIDKFSDSSKVAFYSVAYSLATVIILVQNSLNQVLKPWRYKRLEKKQYRDVKKLSNAMVVLIGSGIIMYMLIVPEAFKLLFQKQYYEALNCMPPITMGVYFLFLYTIFVDIESYYGKTKYIAYVSMVCAALNILLNYLGMKIFPYTVCAYTTLVCYIIMSFLHFLFMKRTCRDAGLSEEPVDSKFIWMFSAGLLVIFGVINTVYSNTALRYGLLGVLLTGIFLYRNQIKALVDQIRK